MRRTEPSTTASTLSVLAISGGGRRRSPLYCVTELREITRSALILARSVISSFGHAVSEIFLVWIARVIVQRKHRDRVDDPRCGGLRGRNRSSRQPVLRDTVG